MKKNEHSVARGRSSTLLVARLLRLLVLARACAQMLSLPKLGSVFGIRTDASTLDLSSVQETFRALKANYDGELDEEALIHGASRGMVAAVGDAHGLS